MKPFFTYSFWGKALLFIGLAIGLAACSSSTGAYNPKKASRSHHKGKQVSRKCPGTASTGNYKPKLRGKSENGLTSKKMAKTMEKKTE